jgi:hypothetical protein
MTQVSEGYTKLVTELIFITYLVSLPTSIEEVFKQYMRFPGT